LARNIEERKLRESDSGGQRSKSGREVYFRRAHHSRPTVPHEGDLKKKACLRRDKLEAKKASKIARRTKISPRKIENLLALLKPVEKTGKIEKKIFPNMSHFVIAL